MNSESCSRVDLRKTGAVSRMKSFQNWPGSSSWAGGGASRMSRSSKPFASSVPAKDSSTMKTTRCPRRRRTSPIPTQLLVGPKAPSGKNTTVAPLIASGDQGSAWTKSTSRLVSRRAGPWPNTVSLGSRAASLRAERRFSAGSGVR